MKSCEQVGDECDKWETSVESCGRRIESVAGDKLGDKCKIKGQRIQNFSGENWEGRGRQVEASVKSCGPEHSAHPECTGRQLGDKGGQARETSVKPCEPEHSEHPKGIGDQWETRGDEWESAGRRVTVTIQSILGDKLETSEKACGPEHSEHPKRIGDQWETRGDEWESAGRRVTVTIQSILGDKLETSEKACGPVHSEYPECAGRQMETGENKRGRNVKSCRRRTASGRQANKWDKCEITRTKALRAPRVWETTRDKRETSLKPCGQIIQSVWGTTGMR